MKCNLIRSQINGHQFNDVTVTGIPFVPASCAGLVLPAIITITPSIFVSSFFNSSIAACETPILFGGAPWPGTLPNTAACTWSTTLFTSWNGFLLNPLGTIILSFIAGVWRFGIRFVGPSGPTVVDSLWEKATDPTPLGIYLPVPNGVNPNCSLATLTVT